MFLEGVQVEGEILVALHLHRIGPREADHLRVGGPVGGGQKHFVPGVHERQEGQVDGLRGSVGDDHLGGVGLQVLPLPVAVHEGFPQFRDAPRGGVVGEPVGDGLLEGLGDGLRGGEIGLFTAHVDDLQPPLHHDRAFLQELPRGEARDAGAAFGQDDHAKTIA